MDARGSYHRNILGLGRMSDEAKARLRKDRGTTIYVYITDPVLTLVHIFDSKTFLYSSLNMSHQNLTKCLETGCLYLDLLKFSEVELVDCVNIDYLTLDLLQDLISPAKAMNRILAHPHSKPVLATHLTDPNRTKEYASLKLCAAALQGDRRIIREYLNGNKTGYYRNVWKFTWIEK
jgi:hypothetical protein